VCPELCANQIRSSILCKRKQIEKLVVVIMAKELGADDHLAVGNVFVSTLLSILTLPIVMMAINRFL
jgi:hypothetical protein